MKWIECKIRYEKTFDEARIAKVCESYLVDALSFTEAEARIIEEMKPFISGDFEVASVRNMNLAELIPSTSPTADCWYRVKILIETIDEEKGISRYKPAFILVQAGSVLEALHTLEEATKGWLVDYSVHTVSETPIMDVYNYTAKEETK